MKSNSLSWMLLGCAVVTGCAAEPEAIEGTSGGKADTVGAKEQAFERCSDMNPELSSYQELSSKAKAKDGAIVLEPTYHCQPLYVPSNFNRSEKVRIRLPKSERVSDSKDLNVALPRLRIEATPVVEGRSCQVYQLGSATLNENPIMDANDDKAPAVDATIQLSYDKYIASPNHGGCKVKVTYDFGARGIYASYLFVGLMKEDLPPIVTFNPPPPRQFPPSQGASESPCNPYYERCVSWTLPTHPVD